MGASQSAPDPEGPTFAQMQKQAAADPASLDKHAGTVLRRVEAMARACAREVANERHSDKVAHVGAVAAEVALRFEAFAPTAAGCTGMDMLQMAVVADLEAWKGKDVEAFAVQYACALLGMVQSAGRRGGLEWVVTRTTLASVVDYARRAEQFAAPGGGTPAPPGAGSDAGSDAGPDAGDDAAGGKGDEVWPMALAPFLGINESANLAREHEVDLIETASFASVELEVDDVWTLAFAPRTQAASAD